MIGSDLVYSLNAVPLLLQTLQHELKEGGTFYYVAPETERDGLVEFLESMRVNGFLLIKKTIAPDSYREGILQTDNENDLLLYFNEIYTKTFHLFEYKKEFVSNIGDNDSISSSV